MVAQSSKGISSSCGFAIAAFVLLLSFSVPGKSVELSPQNPAPAAVGYFWEIQPVGGSAQLVTLFCQPCDHSPGSSRELPLLSFLRDTLGDNNSANDEISYLWLLSSTHQNIGQQLLAAVPFFYWRVGDGATHFNENKPVKPLLDLTRPERPMSVQVLRDVVQWTVLDPISMPVRASTRAYRTNELARERADVEEAIGYLRQAPVSTSARGLTEAETNVVIARLALRKSLLGGLVKKRSLEKVGEQELAQQELIRSRNWDLLRGFAERTGLLFEPLDIAGNTGEYAVLWFPLDSGFSEPFGFSHGAVWKALNLQNPWTDKRLQGWEGPVFERWLDANGSLLPPDTTGVRKVDLVPLGAYSLNYPKFPLLMIDFRDKLHLRRDEMTQRAINEVTAGVIGISHFANWYYYAGAAAFDFVMSRHGRGMNAASRLDSYSQFRSSLALDSELDPHLRLLLEQRIDSVSLNPLEGSPEHKLRIAQSRYEALLNAASSGALEKRLEKSRKAEVRDFGKTQLLLAAQSFLRVSSFGLFDSNKTEEGSLAARLDRQRRAETRLVMLEKVVGTGADPAITYEPQRLRSAVQELSDILPRVESKTVKAQAVDTLRRLRELSRDGDLRADCSFALAQIRASGDSDHLGIEAAPKAVVNSFRYSDLSK